MAYIQKVKRHKGDVFRVFIKRPGFKRVTKSFNSKREAVDFVNSTESNLQRIGYLTSSNTQLFTSDLITEYLSNIYKGTRPRTESRRLQYWIDKIGHKKYLRSPNLTLWRRLISFHKSYLF